MTHQDLDFKSVVAEVEELQANTANMAAEELETRTNAIKDRLKAQLTLMELDKIEKVRVQEGVLQIQVRNPSFDPEEVPDTMWEVSVDNDKWNVKVNRIQ